jgi:hypothetical protein
MIIHMAAVVTLRDQSTTVTDQDGASRSILAFGNVGVDCGADLLTAIAR